jgi:hypothetical protein
MLKCLGQAQDWCDTGIDIGKGFDPLRLAAGMEFLGYRPPSTAASCAQPSSRYYRAGPIRRRRRIGRRPSIIAASTTWPWRVV